MRIVKQWKTVRNQLKLREVNGKSSEVSRSNGKPNGKAQESQRMLKHTLYKMRVILIRSHRHATNSA